MVVTCGSCRAQLIASSRRPEPTSCPNCAAPWPGAVAVPSRSAVAPRSSAVIAAEPVWSPAVDAMYMTPERPAGSPISWPVTMQWHE